MGEKKDCITDSFGKVKEYDNLYVNDSSLINNKLLKNPQGAVMAIACRNIKNFIRNYKKFWIGLKKIITVHKIKFIKMVRSEIKIMEILSLIFLFFNKKSNL